MNERCYYCDQRATKLCDAELDGEPTRLGTALGQATGATGVTCDRRLCGEHALQLSNQFFCKRGHGCEVDTIDYCPEHAAMRLGRLKDEQQMPERETTS